MKTSLSQKDLATYLAGQLNAFFPDGDSVGANALLPWISAAWPRLDHCFSNIHRKYFVDGGEATFSHLHSDQYAMFLYLVSNSVHRGGGPARIAEKIFYLNKVLHGLDCFYGVSLPDIFLFIHPVGTVLGNARYGDYLLAYQNVGVGANEKGVYPTLGRGVVLFAKSTLLGECSIGDNTVFGACAFTINTSIPANSLVVGQYPAQRVLPNVHDVVKTYFRQV